MERIFDKALGRDEQDPISRRVTRRSRETPQAPPAQECVPCAEGCKNVTTRGSNGYATKIKCLDCGQVTEVKKDYGTKDQDTCPHINTTQRDSNRKEHIVTCMDCGKVLYKTSAEEWKDRKHLGAQVSQANRETAETIARTITNEDQTLTVEQAKQVTNVFAASVSAYEERTRKLVEKVKTIESQRQDAC